MCHHIREEQNLRLSTQTKDGNGNVIAILFTYIWVFFPVPSFYTPLSLSATRILLRPLHWRSRIKNKTEDAQDEKSTLQF